MYNKKHIGIIINRITNYNLLCCTLLLHILYYRVYCMLIVFPIGLLHSMVQYFLQLNLFKMEIQGNLSYCRLCLDH